MRLDGIKAIITGGASGLGKACAIELAAKGAKVIVVDKDQDAGRELAATDAAINFCPCDVTKEADVDGMFEQIGRDQKPARIIVNCAGVAPSLRLNRSGVPHCLDAFKHTFDTNVVGTFLPITRFVQQLNKAAPVDEDTGVIINVSSITAFDGQAGQTAYAGSKGAVASMTLPLARELAQNRIRAVCIAPGPFETPMMKNVRRPVDNELGSQVPHPRRLGQPEEFAMLVRHIIENSMINGETIRLDGALRLTPV